MTSTRNRLSAANRLQYLESQEFGPLDAKLQLRPVTSIAARYNACSYITLRPQGELMPSTCAFEGVQYRRISIKFLNFDTWQKTKTNTYTDRHAASVLTLGKTSVTYSMKTRVQNSGQNLSTSPTKMRHKRTGSWLCQCQRHPSVTYRNDNYAPAHKRLIFVC